MTRWTGIVVAPTGARSDAMQSRLPGYLHPVAGRPLIWHVTRALATSSPAPDRVLVIGGANLESDAFGDLAGAEVSILRHDQLGDVDSRSFGESAAVLVVDAAALLDPATVHELITSRSGSWVGEGDEVAAARLDPHLVPEVIRVPTPLQQTRGVLLPSGRLEPVQPTHLVRSRAVLARAALVVQRRIVDSHMANGVTFLLPDTALVDVDVRIGQDTVIYPGAVLEGETNIGAETVIGPGCRVIDSWVGSGVELKGWNYVAHTSIRNRAILEPYVRRGFD